MPSANPDRTPRWALPSPVPSDPPDVPGDMKALADRLDQVIPVAPVAYRSARSVDGTAAASQEATAAEFATGSSMPAGVLVCWATFYWNSTADGAYFFIMIDGQHVPGAGSYLDNENPNKKHVTTIMAIKDVPAGNHVVSAKLTSSASGTTQVFAGCQVSAVVYPQATLTAVSNP